MSESNTVTTYLSVDFGEQGGRYEWKSHEEAEGWLSRLQKQWEWVNGLGHASTNNAWQKIYAIFNLAIGNLQQAETYRNRGNPQRADDFLAAVRTELESSISQFPWLLPNSAQKRFVEDIRDSGNKLEAAIIVASWIGQDLNGTPIRHVVNALLQWELYERGIKERMKTENATLKRLAGDMQTTLTQYQEAEHAQTHRFDKLHGDLTTQQVAQQTSFDEAQQQRAEAWRLQREDAEGELETLRLTYDQHMAIAAPVEYWETKRIKHRNLTWASGVIVIVGMLFVGQYLSTQMQSVSQALMATSSPPMAASSVQAANTILSATPASATWQLGIFIMLAILSFWAIRLLVRIFLSNMHLENDAGERVTMAKTYLALIRSNSVSKDKNIETVLAALFRPTGDGIVKDEGLPPSMLELFTKLGR